MPVYDFKCPECGVETSQICAYEQLDPSPKCQNCDAKLQRVYSAPNIRFKASGFYSTDK